MTGNQPLVDFLRLFRYHFAHLQLREKILKVFVISMLTKYIKRHTKFHFDRIRELRSTVGKLIENCEEKMDIASL